MKRTLATLLLAAALCAASAPALAVTIPWTTESRPDEGHFDIPLSLQSLSDALASAGASGFDGLRTPRSQAGYAALQALVHAALEKMPWLAGEGRANGLWTWRRNPTMGVAIYGPGAGGYNSFSWSRPPPKPATVARVSPRWIPVAYNPNAPRRGPTGAPAPVPLPPAAALLFAAIALIGIIRRLRARAR